MNTLRMALPLSVLAVFLLNAGAQAGTGKIIYKFQGGSLGATPLAGMYLDPNGNLFGTLSDNYSGNKHQTGVVYELKGQGGKWTEKELHQFRANKGDGTRPTGTPVPDGTGALYGTTFTGGQYGGGIVFKLTPPSPGHFAWSYSILYNFNANTEGNATGGGLIFDRTGLLYLTHEGIGVQGVGTVSMLTPPAQGGTAWTNSTIYTFTGGADGAWPSGAPLVFDASGAFGSLDVATLAHGYMLAYSTRPEGTDWAIWPNVGFLLLSSVGTLQSVTGASTAPTHAMGTGLTSGSWSLSLGYDATGSCLNATVTSGTVSAGTINWLLVLDCLDIGSTAA